MSSGNIENNEMKIAILCGGKGKRLRPYTEEIPKTLVPLNNKPILDYNLELYSNKNFKDFILCIGYNGSKICEHIKRKQIDNLPFNVTFSDGGEDASMLERIYYLKEMFDERILVTYGDTLTNIDISDFLRFHKEKKGAISIVVASIQNPFGLVDFDDCGTASTFNEKPFFTYYVGLFILEKKAFHYITDEMLAKPDGEGLVLFFKKLIEEKELYAYQYKGKQITFNTHSEKEIAEEMIKSFYTL